MFDFQASGWRIAHLSPAAQVARTEEGVLIVSDRRQWSYCGEYGPLRAPVTGIFQFELCYRLLEGGVSMGVLSGNRKGWLKSSSTDVATPNGRTISLSVKLKWGQRFWLVLSNNHPEGDGVSRFVVRAPSATVERRNLRKSAQAVATRAINRVRRIAGRNAAVVDAVSRFVVRALSATVERRTLKKGIHAAAVRALDRGRLLLGRRDATVIDVEDGTAYPVAGWREVNPRASSEAVEGGLAISTEPRKWSYCLEYGLRAPVSGRYRFALVYELEAGAIALGLLNRAKKRWLASSSKDAVTAEGRTMTLWTRLRAGEVFWLMVSNNHPAGDAVSRFVVRALSATVERRTLKKGIHAAAVRALDRGRRLLGRRGDETVVGAEDGTQYPLAGWRDVNPRASSAAVEGGLAVTTDPREWSYCLAYGPLRAPMSGTYRFALTYELQEGAIGFGVLNRDQKRWIRCSSNEVIGLDGRTLTVTVDLSKGQRVWLMISNSRADGGGASRFIVNMLSSSVDRLSWRTARVRAGRRLWTATRSRTMRLGRRALGIVADGAKRVARIPPCSTIAVLARRRWEHIRSRIVHQTPEYRLLEEEHKKMVAQLSQLTPLAHLDYVYKLLQERRPDDLHLNGCGDFQLMAREHWFELRGYPEFQTFSMNIDGLFSSIAYYAGIKERALESPYHIYHLEHEVGSGWTPEGEALLRRRIAERGVTWLNAKDVFIWSAYMHWLGRPMIFNSSDWGLGEFPLAESVIESRTDLG